VIPERQQESQRLRAGRSGMKAKLASIRTTLDRLLIAFAGQSILGLLVMLAGNDEANVLAVSVTAALLVLELLIAVALANGAVGLAETASNNLGPAKRAQVLRVRARLGGRSQIAPLTEVEIDELRVLEAGLDAIGIRQRTENLRRESPELG
jgi:hypothetical protein